MMSSPRYEHERGRLMIDVQIAPAAAGNTMLVNQLAALVNGVYAVAGEGVWATCPPRATPRHTLRLRHLPQEPGPAGPGTGVKAIITVAGGSYTHTSRLLSQILSTSPRCNVRDMHGFLASVVLIAILLGVLLVVVFDV